MSIVNNQTKSRMRIHLVSCHRKPERSFFWNKKQFPFCARCTGIYIGYLSFPIFNFDLLYLNSLLSVLLMLPTVIDGLSQAIVNRESNNKIRVITGLLSGVGAMSLMVNMGTIIGNLLLK